VQQSDFDAASAVSGDQLSTEFGMPLAPDMWDMEKIERARNTGSFEVLQRWFRTERPEDRGQEIASELATLPYRFVVMIFVSLDAAGVNKPTSIAPNEIERIDVLHVLGPASYIIGLRFMTDR
jgi:hypothetical protein